MRSSIIAFVVALAAACAPASPVRRAALPTPPAAPPAVETAPLPAPESDAFPTDTGLPARPLLTLGIAQPVGRSVATRTQEALDAYLSGQLEGRVETRIFDNPTALARALVSGEVEAAWMTPLSYVRASAHAPITPIVKLSRGGFTTYRSVIFTRKGRARTLRELKGKRMAWVGRGSTSGRLFPEAHLRHLRIDPQTYFATNLDVDDHREVCRLVFLGEVDAGASLSDEVHPGQQPIVDGCREAGFDASRLEIVERTAPIPNDVIAVRNDLPLVVTDRLREALLALDDLPDGKERITELFQADGFASVVDEDFTVVREVERMLIEQRRRQLGR